MNYAWWSVRGASVDDVAARVIEPKGFIRDPRWMTQDDLDDAPAACFTVGEWTFAVLRDAQKGFEALTNSGEVIELLWDDDNQWSTVTAYRDGRTLWSVYGSVEDDYVRPTGGDAPMPEGIDDLLQETSDCEQVPLQIAERLTGFNMEEPDGYARIVRFATEPASLERADKEEPPTIATRVAEQRGKLVIVDLSIDPVPSVWFPSTTSRDGDRLLIMNDEHAFSIDMSTFPPKLIGVGDDKCDGVALTPWQSTLVACNDDNANGIIRELGGARPQTIGLPFSAVAIDGLRSVPVGAVVFPAYWGSRDAVPQLITTRSDGTREVIRLPLHPVSEGYPDPTAVGFGDESFLLAWQGELFRWHRGALTKLDRLAMEGSVDCAATASDGSVLLRSGYELVRMRPDCSHERVPGFEGYEVYKVIRGPGEAIIITDSDPDAILKVWWPSEGTVAAVEAERLGLEEDAEIIYHDARSNRLCVIATQLHALPWREIEKLAIPF